MKVAWFSHTVIAGVSNAIRKDDFYYKRGGEIFYCPFPPVISILSEWSFCMSLILYIHRQQCSSEDAVLCVGV